MDIPGDSVSFGAIAIAATRGTRRRQVEAIRRMDIPIFPFSADIQITQCTH